MEENEYKSTYDDLTTIRCPFEKTLTNNKAKCSLADHFWLADREGYACKSDKASRECAELLIKLRKNSIFVLKLHAIDGPLPHNMELRVQVGGMLGVAKLVAGEQLLDTLQFVSSDIYATLAAATARFGSLDRLPYSEIIQSVVRFQGRHRRQQ